MVGTLAETWRHGVVWRRCAAVGTPNDCLDLWTTGTCNNCNTGGASLAQVTAVVKVIDDTPRSKLNEIRSSNQRTKLTPVARQFVVDKSVVGLETTVLATSHFVGI